MSLDSIFGGIFETTTTTSISFLTFVICMIVALVLGGFISWVYSLKTNATKSFLVTLSVLPAIICMIIMMVNGNIGAGVAVAGAFSLVRFRSVPGTAKEIGAVFLAMGAGLTIGMGYVAFAILFVLIVSGFTFMLNTSSFGDIKDNQRKLLITIPENLNYTDVFADLFKEYTTTSKLNNVKTTNMGSLFKLNYEIEIIDDRKEKEFIDALRCRNGNLEISISRLMDSATDL